MEVGQGELSEDLEYQGIALIGCLDKHPCACQ